MSFCNIAMEGLIALVDQEDEFQRAEQWLKEHDRMTWERIMEDTLSNLVTRESEESSVLDEAI